MKSIPLNTEVQCTDGRAGKSTAALASLDGKVMRQALDGRMIEQLATWQDGDGSKGVADSLPAQD